MLGAAALLLSAGAAAAFPHGAPAKGSGWTATAIAAGDRHSCARTSAGAVKCWGGNHFGQLGDGTTTARHSPVAVSGLSNGVTAIAAGSYHSCALTSAGAVKCWGHNYLGQLGDGTTTSRHSPVAVAGFSNGVTAIAAGGYHSCALTSAGAVKCWGDNIYGQIGDGTTTWRYRPVAVSGLSNGVTAIAVGWDYSCALTSAGAVKCWGWNDVGQLGDGTTAERHSPVAVSGLSNAVTAIAAGGLHSCALTRAGAVKCWGDNGSGQLGDRTTTERHSPVGVSGLSNGVTAIAAGGYHSCALTRAGAVKCWGDNRFGQLGDRATTDRDRPVAVSGLSKGVTAIAAGHWYSCALTSAGAVKCWGENRVGQLGDGTTTERHRPVDVIGVPRCIVPNVIGELLPKAKTAIKRAHCRVGNVVYKRSAKEKKNRVLAETPKPGAHVKNQAKVKLTVGRG